MKSLIWFWLHTFLTCLVKERLTTTLISDVSWKKEFSTTDSNMEKLLYAVLTCGASRAFIETLLTSESDYHCEIRTKTALAIKYKVFFLSHISVFIIFLHSCDDIFPKTVTKRFYKIFKMLEDFLYVVILPYYRYLLLYDGTVVLLLYSIGHQV